MTSENGVTTRYGGEIDADTLQLRCIRPDRRLRPY
jgi:hypothetical protein